MTRPEAIRVLRDPAQLRYFAPFVARDRTLHEVARETGCKPNTLYARARRYLEWGLLKVVGARERAGRAIKVYRSAADELFIPLDHPGDLEAYLRWNRFWEVEIVNGLLYAYGSQAGPPGWGSRVYRDASGVLTSALSRDPARDYDPLAAGEPATYSLFHDAFELDYDQAKEFQRELAGLARRYAGRRGAQRYLVRLNLIPLPPGSVEIP